MVRGIDVQWQADLVDMMSLSSINHNTNYILTVIDVFSKFAWNVPIKKKTGKEITQAFQKIFKERTPKKLQTDKATEFISKETKALLKSKGIHCFATENENKAQIVEWFSRTLKDRMFRYFTANKTKHWLSVLPKLVENYNTSHHRSIKMTPIEASNKQTESAVWHNLYGNQGFNLDYRGQASHGKPPVVNPHSNLKAGEQVRIFKLRGKFKRGYTPNYRRAICH